MDNLTHSLVGALIGQAGLKKKTGLGMPALIIGANLPDVDATCTIYGLESLAMRRGLTHGPIAWVLLPLVLAAILYGWDHWQAKRGKRPEGRAPVRFFWLYALALIGCLTHPALDWLNSYGIRFLEPFSSRWFYGDALFIIDIWAWLGLGLALWLSLRREKRQLPWKGPAQAALAAFVAYVGFNVVLARSLQYVDTGGGTLIANPVPLAFWQRQAIWGDEPGIWYVDGRRYGDVLLTQCDLATARADDPRLDAFLFWSRAPYVSLGEDGGWFVGDARFASRAAGRFSVALPAEICEG